METRPAGRRGPKPRPDTRSNLIEAGVRTIHAEGFAATGIQSIVEKAHVPKGSFYNHFSSKEAFGADVIDAYSNLGQERLRTFLENADVGPLERVESYFDDRIRAFRENDYARGCLMGNFSAEAADHSPMIRERLAAHFKAWGDLFEKCISEAQDLGQIGNQMSPDVLARFIFNSWEGALLRMRAEKSDAPLLDFKKIIFDIILAKHVGM